MAETTPEQAKATFPEVDDSKIDHIFSEADAPTLAYIADVLEAAAAKGKVPDAPYMDRAADVVLDKIDESELPGVEKEDILRGMRSKREAEKSQHKDEAVHAAQNEDLATLIEMYNDKAALASNALAAPEAETIPESVNQASIILTQAIAERLDILADRGDMEALKQAQNELAAIQNEPFRDKMYEKLNGLYQLVQNSGTEYEQVKEQLLDEDNTPAEVRQMVDEIESGQYDVTLEQAKDLIGEATDWLEQYRQLAQANAEEAEEAEEEG